MNNNFFNDYSGLNTLEWWLGQVVDEKNWSKNENDSIHKRDDIAGWGKRYKVRIFGRDSKQKDTKDDELEMAEVLYPVTAGSGHAGATQTANIRQGAYVIGFYKDGVDATEPIIMGVLGNNAQTRLYGGDPNDGFTPRTGYKGLDGDKDAATKNMYAEGPSSIFFDEAGNVNPLSWVVSLVDQVKDGTPCEFIPKTRACEGPGGETRGMQSAIQKALADINRIKAEANSFIGAASDLSSDINNVVNTATNLISQAVKVTINEMRGYVVNKLNAGVSDLIDKLPPNQRPGFNQANETATDTLQCVFNKIIRGLADLVKQLLEEIIDQYVNAPLCAVEQFLSSLLGSILGDITDAINSALAVLSSALGGAISFVGSALDVLSIISGVLSFLSCDEPPACTSGDQWSFWNGASCVLDDVSDTLSTVTSAIISGVAAPPCDTSQLPCGPPIITISGPTGSGALGNPIISATGAILGIDLVNGGSGYVAPPNVAVTQNCNNGGGAVIESIIDTQGITGVGIGSVVGFNIIDSGTGYLPAPDGSTGGNGITFSQPCDTLVKTAKSGYEEPKKPGTVVSVIPGDVVYLPPATVVEIFNSNGVSVQTLNGLGQLTPITITASGSFTSPECVPGSGSGFNGSYPVILEIGEVIINNPGLNYSPEDPIRIIPDNGASLIPIYNGAGSLTGVNIQSPGIGFTEYPNIFIESQTGINANIVPQFKIVKILSDVGIGSIVSGISTSTAQGVAISAAQVVHVVDCVGKIPLKNKI